MFNLLIRTFIKDYKNVGDNRVRTSYGTLSSVVGIILNLLICAIKLLVGFLTASVAIVADGFNNLSDAGSSVISFISFKISGKPADKEHPYGHARFEYIASLIVSFIIIYVSISLFKESIDKIINATETTINIWSIIVLVISILVKLWLCFFNKTLSKAVHSIVIEATAADSLSDVFATGAVLLSIIISSVSGFNTDGYFGILVSIFIFINGFKILLESKDSIIGNPPDPELAKGIVEFVESHEGALGVHDLLIHSYGPNCYFASLHVEVDGKKDLFDSHDMIDNLEVELSEKFNIICCIHIDPIVVDDPRLDSIKEKAKQIANEIFPGLNLHDFRMVAGPTHTNIIFDVAVPFECKIEISEIKETLTKKVSGIEDNLNAVIKVERNIL